MAPAPDAGSGASTNSLRAETARMRDLSAECRRAGISLEHVPEEIQSVRDLVVERRYDAALERIRELKLDLLARLLIAEPERVPPASLENAPVGVSPSGEDLAAFNAMIEKTMRRAPRARRRR